MLIFGYHPGLANIPTTEPKTGLTSRQAEDLLRQYGPNDPAPRARHSMVRDLLFMFVNPLVVILLIAAALSGFLGQVADAFIIVIMVLTGIAIYFYQSWRSQIAIEDLRLQVAPTATIMRDGEWREIHRHDVVPGDLVRLSAGDLVPADSRLVESRDLYIQQAALTGESLPTEKEVTGDAPSDAPDARNMVFLGTS